MKWANYLQTQNLPRLNHGEIENLNSLWLKETESVVKNLQQSKAPDLMTSLVNSIKHFKKFYKIIEEGPLTKSFYEATITLILKSKTLQGKQEKTKAATPISLWIPHGENPQQNTQKTEFSGFIKTLYHKWVAIMKYYGHFNISNQ